MSVSVKLVCQDFVRDFVSVATGLLTQENLHKQFLGSDTLNKLSALSLESFRTHLLKLFCPHYLNAMFLHRYYKNVPTTCSKCSTDDLFCSKLYGLHI